MSFECLSARLVFENVTKCCILQIIANLMLVAKVECGSLKLKATEQAFIFDKVGEDVLQDEEKHFGTLLLSSEIIWTEADIL